MTATPAVVTPPDHRFPWYVRILFWMQKRRYGAVLESARLWARTPKVFVALAVLYAAFERRSSPIEPGLRTLLIVRVSQINGCTFCVDLNSAVGLRRGVSMEKLMALPEFAGSALFTNREKVALRFAEAVTCPGVQRAAAHFEQLRRHFDDEAIIELTGLIAFQNLSSKFNAALGVAPQGFCPIAPGPPITGPRTDPDQRKSIAVQSS